jgi:hypothetical protein
MLNLYGIVTAILKMATARNFSMSGIYSGHQKFLAVAMPFSKWPPQYRPNSTLFDFKRPEFIPDIEKFLPVSIFKMASKDQMRSVLFKVGMLK